MNNGTDWQKSFWETIINNKEDHVFANGRCYFVGDCQQVGTKGFDGASHTLRNLKTGELLETTNLWYNGIVPEEYKEKLPDTHVFE